MVTVKNLRVCKSCNIEKDVELDFSLLVRHKGSHKKYRRHICKSCDSKRSALLTKEKCKDPLYKSMLLNKAHNRHRKNKEAWISFMGGICFDCGIIGHSSIYDFHHINPTIKEHSGLKLLSPTRLEDAIKEELSNCVLLCANCHRTRHAIHKETGCAL